MTTFRSSSDSGVTVDDLPGCVQELGQGGDQQRPVHPPGQSPPLLPMHEGWQAGPRSHAQKTLEEHFESLRFDLNMTCEYALMNLGRLENDNSRLSTELLANKSQSGNVHFPPQHRPPEMALAPLRDAAQPRDDVHGEASVEAKPPVNGETSVGLSKPAPKVQNLEQPYRKTMLAVKNSAAHSQNSATYSCSLSNRTQSTARRSSRFVEFEPGSSVYERSIFDIERKFCYRQALREHSKISDDSDDARKMDVLGVFRRIVTDRNSTSKAERTPMKKFQPHAVFADAEAMKDRVRTAMKKPEYDVRNFYKTQGIAQNIARSSWFDQMTLVVIAFNSVWIGIECDSNDGELGEEVPIGFRIVDNFFCTYFLLEIIVRFTAFKRTRDAFGDAWFCFDLIMSVLYVFETWILAFIFQVSGADSDSGAFKNSSVLRSMRLFRLTRMARISRLLRALPEVMILIKGVALAMRSVFFTLILLVIIMYIFAVGFVQLTRDTDVGKEYFGNVPDAMKTLLLNGTFLENIPDCYHSCAAQHELLGLLLLVYVLLASLTVMNMLIGVLVDVVSVVASVEKESLVTTYVKQYLEGLWMSSGMDLNGDGMVSQDEFELLLQHPDATRCLNSVGVDVVGLVDFADFIFRGEDISFVDFVELVLTLRGTNTARVKDIVDLRKYMAMELEHKLHLQECLVSDLANKFEAMVKAMVQTFDGQQRRQFDKTVRMGSATDDL